MTDIINLRQQRKRKSSALKEKQAKENRSKFGRTKAEKELQTLKDESAKRHIESHKREPDEE